MKKIILWHRRDLRVVDNAALYKASKVTSEIIPVFVIDPIFFESKNLESKTNPDRILFMFKCLEDLDRQYQKLGTKLIILYGNSIIKLKELSSKLKAEVYYNFDTNMVIAKKRDCLASKHPQFRGFSNDAVSRFKNLEYKEWGVNCKDFFEEKILRVKDEFKINPNNLTSEITFEELIEKYNIKAEKSITEKPGREEALKRLDIFARFITLYPKSISKPFLAEKNCSRLSANLSFGTISVREVYQRIKREKVNDISKKFYISRLFWHEHFTQRLHDFPDITTIERNPRFKDLNKDNYNKELCRKFFKAKTGYPIVDAAITALKTTGWINFRMRAMIASFFCHILKQPWKIGADWMHYHLLDSDTAINYSQWQMQGTVGGMHPLRMYNPIKQQLEKDSEGKFVKKYLKEFENVENIEMIAEPWKFPYQLKELGVVYPKRIVKYDEEAKKTKEFFTNHLRKVNDIEFNKSIKKSDAFAKKKNKPQKDKSLNNFI